MNKVQTSPTGGLSPEYRNYDKQRCFVGHSVDAPWCKDLVMTCNEVLPDFDLEPWYAVDHFAPTKSLREKVVELIANTRYGIYDLSYWRKDDKSEWHMPRNVFIELGIAIALNRPMLLLRHKSNRISSLPLPQCLESISTHILEFSGSKTLRDVLKERLSQWANTPPDQDWWNRYCTFGSRVCEHREAHPSRLWGQQTLRCHISDGKDADRLDFHGVVEEVLGRFENVSFDYLDALSPCKGYNFLLCTHCQTVRSTPFAIYRITEHTPPETFIAIGMSLALETQFTHTIPRILLTSNIQHIPSLLAGYEVVIAQNDYELKTSLRKFMPQVIQLARKTTWKQRPLPFREIAAQPVEKPTIETVAQPVEKPTDEKLINSVPPGTLLHGRYRVQRVLGSGGFGHVYLAVNSVSNLQCAVKEYLVTGQTGQQQLEHEASVLSKLHHPNLPAFQDGFIDRGRYYLVHSYIDGNDLTDLIRTVRQKNDVIPIPQILQWLLSVCDAAIFLHSQQPTIIHRDIKPDNVRITPQGTAVLIDLGNAKAGKEGERTLFFIRHQGTPGYAPPEQYPGGSGTDARSDIYGLGATLFFALTAQEPPSVQVRNQSAQQGLPTLSSLQDQLRKNPPEESPEALAARQQFRLGANKPSKPTPRHSRHIAQLGTLPPDLLTRLNAIVQKSMELNPRRRYQLVADLVHDLRQVVMALGSTPLPPPMRPVDPYSTQPDLAELFDKLQEAKREKKSDSGGTVSSASPVISQNTGNIYCPRCGTSLVPKAVFCSRCGQAVRA